jgi:hypothetical protein
VSRELVGGRSIIRAVKHPNRCATDRLPVWDKAGWLDRDLPFLMSDMIGKADHRGLQG